jgi:plastocyanin
MSKYILIAVVIVILIAGGYFLVKGQNKTQQPAQNTQSSQSSQPSMQPSSMKSQSSSTSANSEGANNVRYTGSGFEPNSITIKAGQAVTWTDKSTDDMWVASNPHPTHTDYPGFDALKNIPPNGTYSFTFTKVGTWGYHNHLNPSQQGEVIVTK